MLETYKEDSVAGAEGVMGREKGGETGQSQGVRPQRALQVIVRSLVFTLRETWCYRRALSRGKISLT